MKADDLFDNAGTGAAAPLADRMRPRTLDDVIGQEHIVGAGRLLRRSIQADRLSSVIFYGPPGTGKTSLARVIANSTKSYFESLNAVLSGIKDIREAIDRATERQKLYGRRTILFVDEVHRWNKAQQDALLPWVENGTVILIGATTENPFFEVNRALVSRSRIFQLKQLDAAALRAAALRALADRENGYGQWKVRFEEGALEHLVEVAGGDARSLLNALELAVETSVYIGDRGQGTGDRGQGIGDSQGAGDRGQGIVGSEWKPSTNVDSAVSTDKADANPTPYTLKTTPYPLKTTPYPLPPTPSSWPPPPGAEIYISMEAAEESIQRRAVLYDRDGDYHFDTISAFIKSVRGSDPDAALYWLAKMVRAGEDPAFIFRRMVILASEDVGMADPYALGVVISCAKSFERIGFPEGNYPLAHACLYLATAPKSNSAMAFFDALGAVDKEDADVPNHLRDASRDKEGFGHGEGYVYPHAYRDHWRAQQYLPSVLQGKIFYVPSEIGYEKSVRAEVLRKREVQAAALLEESEDKRHEKDELLNWSPSEKGREHWYKRLAAGLEGGRGEALLAARDAIFAAAAPVNTARIFIPRADDGLLVWESLRRSPAGLTAATVTGEPAREALLRFARSGGFEDVELPKVGYRGQGIGDSFGYENFIPTREAAEEVFGCGEFEHILIKEPLRYVSNLRGGSRGLQAIRPPRSSRASASSATPLSGGSSPRNAPPLPNGSTPKTPENNAEFDRVSADKLQRHPAQPDAAATSPSPNGNITKTQPSPPEQPLSPVPYPLSPDSRPPTPDPRLPPPDPLETLSAIAEKARGLLAADGSCVFLITPPKLGGRLSSVLAAMSAGGMSSLPPALYQKFRAAEEAFFAVTGIGSANAGNAGGGAAAGAGGTGGGGAAVGAGGAGVGSFDAAQAEQAIAAAGFETSSKIISFKETRLITIKEIDRWFSPASRYGAAIAAALGEEDTARIRAELTAFCTGTAPASGATAGGGAAFTGGATPVLWQWKSVLVKAW